MAKKQNKKLASQSTDESDSTYFLKLVLYVILGSLWLRLAEPLHFGVFTLSGLPIGLLLGILFASHDHFQIDRKIAYAILLVMTILTYFLPAGIVI